MRVPWAGGRGPQMFQDMARKMQMVAGNLPSNIINQSVRATRSCHEDGHCHHQAFQA
jgi:hypothetical protein